MTEPLMFKQLIDGQQRELVSFATDPSRYQHWTLRVDGDQPDVARLKLDINEDGGIRPGYKLKLNSYDLGVDIELHDALNRIRFEHPAVKVVVFESGKEKSGARAPTSTCRACLPMAGRSTFASSPTKPATASKTLHATTACSRLPP